MPHKDLLLTSFYNHLYILLQRVRVPTIVKCSAVGLGDTTSEGGSKSGEGETVGRARVI